MAQMSWFEPHTSKSLIIQLGGGGGHVHSSKLPNYKTEHRYESTRIPCIVSVARKVASNA